MSDIATKLITIAENQKKVHDAGYSKGYELGAESVNTDAFYQQGVEDERKAFWYQIQQNGVRYWYAYAFAYWMDGDSYDPIYEFNNAYVASMFYQSGITDTKVPISSRAMIADGLFSGARKLVRVPYLDLTYATSIKNVFNGCAALEDITFGGYISLSLDLHWSTKLSKASIGKNNDYYDKGIVPALDEYVSGETLTLSLEAVNNAFETSEGAADGSTSAEWTTLIAPKQAAGWTITLV